jgi:hypothetical protein
MNLSPNFYFLKIFYAWWQIMEKLLMEQADILWNLYNFIFSKDKIDYNKIILSLVVQSSAEPKFLFS